MDAGHVVDGVADLVSDETGLGDQVGLDGLVDGGSGDSDGDGGVDGVHVDGRDGVDGSNWGGVDGSHGSGSNSGSSSNSRGSSVGKTVSGNKAVSGETDTSVASAKEPVAGDQLGGGGGHGGAEDGGKDNLEEKRMDKNSN